MKSLFATARFDQLLKDAWVPFSCFVVALVIVSYLLFGGGVGFLSFIGNL